MTFATRHERGVRYTAAFLFFVLVTVVWFHDVAFHPSSRIPCCISDGSSTIRDYVTASLEHKNLLTFAHDAYNGAPEGTDRAPATVIANAGLQTLVLSALRGPLGLVVAWNFYALLGLLGTAMAMFWLLQRLGCTTIASLFGAYALAFSPYAMERVYAGHTGLMQSWILVLAVAAMLAFRDHRSYGRAVLVGAVIGLAFYISAYEGLLASITVLAFLAVELWRLPRRPDRVRSLALTTVVYGIAFLALIPLLYAYSRERTTVRANAAHATDDLYTFAARLSSYLVPSPRNPLAHWLAGEHSRNLTEQTIYFGYVTLALAVVAVILLARHDRWLRESETRRWTAISAAVLVPLAFVLSLPPTYHVGSLRIPMPSILIAGSSSFWRVYSRFGVLVGFGMAILAALGLSVLATRRGRGWRLLGPAALIVLVLEFLPGNVGALDIHASPPWVAWLAAQPRGIVATYPMDLKSDGGVELGLDQYWYQTIDHDPGFAIVGQSYLQARSRNQAIRFLALDPSKPLTARVLSTEGVRYVVIDDGAYARDKTRPPQVNPRWFKLLERFGPVGVYSVNAPRTDIAAALRSHRAEIARLAGLPVPVPVRPRPR